MNEYKSKVQKRPLILFSGGLDSTYLVLSQLAVSSVDLLIVKSNRLYDVQERAEEKARNAIIKQIRQETENGRLKHGIVNVHTVTMNFEHSHPPSFGDKFAQIRFWLLAALETINPDIHSHLYLGYVSGDQITPHISGLKKIWKHLYSVSKIGKVKISFPLLYMSKQDLIDRMQTSGNLGYLDLVWYCERPIEKPKRRTKPCGTCMSCKRMPDFKGEDVSKIIEVK